jgi:hypothetical protein
MIIVSYLSHLGAKDLRSCERPPYPQTLSNFQGGPFQEIVLRVTTSGIVTADFSHQRSYHYQSQSIEEASMIIVSHLTHLGAKDLRSCSWLV